MHLHVTQKCDICQEVRLFNAAKKTLRLCEWKRRGRQRSQTVLCYDIRINRTTKTATQTTIAKPTAAILARFSLVIYLFHESIT